MMAIEPVPLHRAARERYLTYALSVITSRALPDVRDGLKPVQRRILYTMFHELSLHPDGRYRKCAAIVGEVMGKFHPHGDQAIYDALVRIAQPFSLLHPLIDGQGNFGSLDGDRAAAMRYTEAKLHPLAEELITEIKKETVDFRPTYDGQRLEPIVLPAQFPQMLVNGVEGIAVGMATRIPPHNLGEVVNACVAYIDDRDIDVPGLMAHIQGPDFPTGGRILTDSSDLRAIYETGSGPVRLQATWTTEKDGRRPLIVITSVPYGQNKSRLIERIASEVEARKLPQVTDVRDESTDIVRVVIELKVGGSAEAVMAYLFKHTPLEGTWSANLTCLVPTGTGVGAPERLNLREIIDHWCRFRFDTTRRRFEYELRKLRERIHLLEGFAILFDALDEAIRLIRESEGKRDAAERLIARFRLSEVQVDAILELRLYKLAKLEIAAIREELEEKRAQAARIEAILASNDELWRVVRTELVELRRGYAQPRRTEIGEDTQQLTYNEDAYIVDEDTFVVVTRGGWLKRQSSFTEMAKIRVREEDEIAWLFKASTRTTVTFLGSSGAAYTMRVDDVPATTGYGEPLQKHFAMADGEHVAGVLSHDPRHRLVNPDAPRDDDDPEPPWAVAVTTRGRVLRFTMAAHSDPSNRNGRKFARLNAGDAVLAAYACDGTEHVSLATVGGNALAFPVSEVPLLKAAGKGVTGIKLKKDDPPVLAFSLATRSTEGVSVSTNNGRDLVVTPRKYGGSRGARGGTVIRRGTIDVWHRSPHVALATDAATPTAPKED